MRKLSISVLAFFVQMLTAHAQTDSNAYKSRKLKIDEINLVSAYYTQDGNNSAVTGGIGTEKLNDFGNTLELRLIKTDAKDRIHNYSIEMGIDHYSSASSDKIDPSTVSSASYSDTRFYPTISYSLNNQTKNFIVGGALSYSSEFDYKSKGVGLNFAKLSKDKNTELALKLQAYFDTWTVIYPIELRPPGGREFSGRGSNNHSPRDSYSGSLSFSRVVNRRFQFALLLDGVYQKGLLATDYQRVYFLDNTERIEKLPDKRVKLPIGIRASYFMGDRIILRGFYRYYTDDWGIHAHTASLEVPIKINPFLSVSPFYRYYSQTSSDYFSPYKTHLPTDVFYTSDYDLSAFNSQFFGAGIRWSPEKGVLGVQHWTMIEIRYGHYTRNTGLQSNIITLNAKFK